MQTRWSDYAEGIFGAFNLIHQLRIVHEILLLVMENQNGRLFPALRLFALRLCRRDNHKVSSIRD
jgi:hypothetical protein